MPEKYKNILVLLLTGAFLLGFSVWGIFKPDETLSVSERRTLAQFPEPDAGSILSGKFMSDFEAYTLDQFPLRDRFRTLKAVTALEVLRQKDNNGVYFQNGYVSKLDYPLHESSVDHAAARFRAVYERYLENTGCKIYLAVVPDKNYYTDADYPKMDYAALTARLRDGMDYAQYIDLSGCLRLENYYRTDPHWNQATLAATARFLAASLGTEGKGDFHAVRLDTPFYGSYYGQAALPMEPDELVYLTNDVLEDCVVHDFETDTFGKLYDKAAAQGRDPYELFLSGPKSVLTIENPHAQTDRELVLFRDSYGSSIAPLLAEGYAKITLIDIRYLAPELLGRFVDFGAQDVLFLYSATVLNSSETLR